MANSVTDWRNGQRVHANGINFNVIVRGPEGGHPVVLLHGFPDSAQMWESQVPALADAGYRVIAPDLRGHGETDAPSGVENYRINPCLVADVMGLLDALGLGGQKVTMVGHDWGAALAWAVAGYHPEVVERLLVLSVGHPNAIFSVGGWKQRQKFFYMLLFGMEGLLDDRMAEFMPLMNEATGGGLSVMTPHLERMVGDLLKPGGATPKLNWYRANVTPDQYITGRFMFGETPDARCQVLLMAGEGDDVFFEEASYLESAKHCPPGQFRFERIPSCGHMMTQDQPEIVTKAILDFVANSK